MLIVVPFFEISFHILSSLYFTVMQGAFIAKYRPYTTLIFTVFPNNIADSGIFGIDNFTPQITYR